MKALKIVGCIMSVILFAVSAALIYLTMSMKLVPTPYAVIVAVVLAAISVCIFFLAKKGTKKLRIMAIIIASVLSILLGVMCYFMAIANKAMDDVTGNTTETDEINVYVGRNDAVESVNEAVANDYLFGIVNTVSSESVQQTLDEMKQEVNADIRTEGYESIYAAVGAFENGRIQGLIVIQPIILQIQMKMNIAKHYAIMISAKKL